MEGKLISHFRILSKAGQGGMGVVYKAEDVNLGRTVAIKVLPPDLMQDEKRKSRFVSEARTAAAVTHPHLCTIHEIGEADGVTFIAMEYLEGETLRERMVRQPLTLQESVALATQIAEGLAAAHQAKIVHRDLKPDNVMITPEGRAKILDFGLARLLEPMPDLDQEATIAATQVQNITDARAILGTPGYMSPEQARGQELDFRSDIFSFGCTFYEMLTGQAPFRGGSSADTISHILHKDPQPLVGLVPEAPAAVQWILDKCLSKAPGERFQNTSDLVVDLRRVGKDSDSHSGIMAPSSPDYRAPTTVTGSAPGLPTARNRWPLIGVAAALLLLAAIFGPRMFGNSPAPPTAEANSLAIFPFENLHATDDPDRYGQIFQDVLITALTGMEPLKVFSGQRLFDLQKQVSNGGERIFEKEFATRVAQRAGAEHMLTGSLGKLGETWILTCQMLDVADGSVVLSKRIDGQDLYAIAADLTGALQTDLRVQMPRDTEMSAPRTLRGRSSESLEAYKHYLSGIDLMNEVQMLEAAKEFQAAIEIDPDFGQAYYQLALAQYWPGEQFAAKATLQTMLDRNLFTSELERLMGEGLMALIAGDHAESLPKFEAVTQKYPDEKHGWYQYGESLYHLAGGSRRAEAIPCFEKAVALDPDFQLAYEHIFDALFEEERYDEALERVAAALERQPESAYWNRMRARVVAWSAPPEDISSAANQALRFQTKPQDRRELYKILAQVMISRGLPLEQEDFLRKAAAEDPNGEDPRITADLIGMLQPQARWPEYEAVVREQLQRDPYNQRWLTALNLALEQQGRHAEALVDARRLATEHPDEHVFARRWLYHAICIGDAPSIAAATKFAEEAADTIDKQRFIPLSVGRAHAYIGNLNLALREFQELLANFPDQSRYWVLLDIARVHQAQGRWDEAVALAEEAIAENPTAQAGYFTLVGFAADRGEWNTLGDLLRTAMDHGADVSWSAMIDPMMLVMQGRLEEARPQLEQFVGGPGPQWLTWQKLCGVGSGLADVGELEEARRFFERALQLDARRYQVEAYEGLARIALLEGDATAAEKTLRTGLAVQDYNLRLRGLLIPTLLQLGRPAEAAAVVSEIQSIRAPVEAERWLALVRAAEGRYAEARLLAERCVERDSTRASYAALAWILVSGELDLELGLQTAEKAMEIPLGREAFFQRHAAWPAAEHSAGLAYLKQGKPDQALPLLKIAAERIPHRSLAIEHLRRAESETSGR